MGCNVIAWAASNPSTLISMLETTVKYYYDRQIQLRENNSLIHLSSGVYYTTQASIHPSSY